MEAVGVSLAVVPLFLEAVKAYKLFLDGKDLDKSMAHFQVRLNIEYLRLVFWGKASGFPASETDPQHISRETELIFLENNFLYTTTKVALDHIQTIVSDATKLSKVYGVSVKEQPAEQRLVRLGERVPQLAKTGLLRFRWAVKDKDDFEKMLEQLKYYNDSLDILHDRAIIRTKMRDILAWLLRETSPETLRRLQDVAVSEPRSSADATIPLATIASGASIIECFQNDPNRLPTSTDAMKEEPDLDLSIPGHALIEDAAIEIATHIRTARNTDNGKPGVAKRDARDPKRVLKWQRDVTYDSKSGVVVVAATAIDGAASTSTASDTDNDEPEVRKRDAGSLVRLATWKRDTADGPKSVRVFVEAKHLTISDDYSYEFDGRDSSYRYSSEMRTLEGLAYLLHEAGSAPGYGILRCVGMTKFSKSGSAPIKLVYELPSWADPVMEPATLADVIGQGSDRERPPSLDIRFGLAKMLVAAVHQLHCASWMHKDLSPRNLAFFKRTTSSAARSENALDLEHPYLIGFQHARHISSKSPGMHDTAPVFQPSGKLMREFQRLMKSIYCHPGYLLRKGRVQGTSQTFYRLRHDYYSLGLILLQIGLWMPLEDLQVPRADPPSPQVPVLKGLSQLTPTWLDELNEDVWSNIDSTIKDDTTWEELERTGWPSGLKGFAETLKQTMAAEDLDPTRSLRWRCRAWMDLYPLALVRQAAIQRAQRDLGSLMGTRYQTLVLRCLEVDFGKKASDSEAQWLNAFNWLVVKELEQCRL